MNINFIALLRILASIYFMLQYLLPITLANR